MSQKPIIVPDPPPQARRKPASRLATLGASGKRPALSNGPRRASVVGLTSGTKAQRTSKTTQKLVVLPSAPQTRPLLAEEDEDLTLGYETDGGIREYKSAAERMRKIDRKQAGFKRITAYCVAESFKMKLLTTFLKREHNVSPRIFDEAVYTMYHLPLLPGYGPNTNVRSSVSPKKKTGKSVLGQLSEAEEDGYQGSYFTPHPSSPVHNKDGYISTSPIEIRKSILHPSPTSRRTHFLPDPSSVDGEGDVDPGLLTEPEVVPSSLTTLNANALNLRLNMADDGKSLEDAGAETDPGVYGQSWRTTKQDDIKPTPNEEPAKRRVIEKDTLEEEDIAEVVFFEYGVVVFFGLQERQEKDILEDIDRAGIIKRKFSEEDWEIEECHYEHDPHIAYPRIYNDFFTLKSRSHLLKLSIAHALAQSTLLARYETTAQQVLSSPLTVSIPRQLAEKGVLRLRRHEALKLTGRLFKLRRDINLVSNVLDVPELFWSEASLKDLYSAVREYMEIRLRVEVLNEKLNVASDFLDAIHDHLNNNAMDRITWIVIGLIMVAILVELGEIVARLVFHSASTHTGVKTVAKKMILQVFGNGEALRTL